MALHLQNPQPHHAVPDPNAPKVAPPNAPPPKVAPTNPHLPVAQTPLPDQAALETPIPATPTPPLATNVAPIPATNAAPPTAAAPSFPTAPRSHPNPPKSIFLKMAGFTLRPGALKNHPCQASKTASLNLHPTQPQPPDFSRFKKISPLTASRLSTVLCSFLSPHPSFI